MLGEADDYMHKEKENFRTLKELYKNLQVPFEELKTSHNNLKESCEKLVEAQNSSLVHALWWSPRMLESLVTYLIALQVIHNLLVHL
jgi:hypothetical protein